MAAANSSVADHTWEAGTVVLMRVVSKRSHVALARKLERQKVLIVRALPYSKYNVYTQFGMLKDSVHANEFQQLPAGSTIPEALALTNEQLLFVLDEYNRGKGKPLTNDSSIASCRRRRPTPSRRLWLRPALRILRRIRSRSNCPRKLLMCLIKFNAYACLLLHFSF
jgi:hypothetical protein